MELETGGINVGAQNWRGVLAYIQKGGGPLAAQCHAILGTPLNVLVLSCVFGLELHRFYSWYFHLSVKLKILDVF